jgi:hypothetical protein
MGNFSLVACVPVLLLLSDGLTAVDVSDFLAWGLAPDVAVFYLLE